MLYATLKTVHLICIIVWLGGMFFALACLRPSLAVLDAPMRPRLMAAVLGRFFSAVAWASGLALASGGWMMATRGAGGAMPPGVSAMAALGLVMIGVFVYVRVGPYSRLKRALGQAVVDAAAAGAALDAIRKAVIANLLIGAAIVVITQWARYT